MKTTTETLAAARENEVKFATEAEQRHAELQAAIDAKAQLIVKAAAGANVKTEQLTAAETKIRDAESVHLLAKAIHSGATTARHKAEIAAWQDEAAEIEKAMGDAVTGRIEAARKVDAALSALSAAIAAYNNAGQAVLRERHRAGHFNAALPERDSDNPHHAALLQKPRVHHQYGAEIGALDCTVFDRDGWRDIPPCLKNIAEREASKWGIVPNAVEQAA